MILNLLEVFFLRFNLFHPVFLIRHDIPCLFSLHHLIVILE